MKLLSHYVLSRNSVAIESREIRCDRPSTVTSARLDRIECEPYRMQGSIRAVLLGRASVFALMCLVPFCMALLSSGSQTDSPEVVSAPSDVAKDSASMDLEHFAEADLVVPAFGQDVVSVTGIESTIGRSPAAIFVITDEMIHRSGVTSLPKALVN